MGTYKVEGTFKMGQQWPSFSKLIDADHPERAVELITKKLGGSHKCQRRFIQISRVVESKAPK